MEDKDIENKNEEMDIDYMIKKLENMKRNSEETGEELKLVYREYPIAIYHFRYSTLTSMLSGACLFAAILQFAYGRYLWAAVMAVTTVALILISDFGFLDVMDEIDDVE